MLAVESYHQVHTKPLLVANRWHLSFLENRQSFVSNAGALSASSPLVGGMGGPSLSEVIWPADCAENEMEIMKGSTRSTT